MGCSGNPTLALPAGFAGLVGLRHDQLLDEGFEKLCLICSSLPSITGPTRLRRQRVEVPPSRAICLPAALLVASFSPCSVLSTRTQPAAVPVEGGLLGSVIWSSDCQQRFLHPLSFNLIFAVFRQRTKLCRK